jgi:rhodanese-related sulfurtransferase
MNIIMKSGLFLVFLLFSLGAAAGEETPDTIPGTTKVTAEDIFDLVEAHLDLVIIDARKTDDRNKGFIEGSIGLPDTDTTEESLAQVIPSKATPVLFYCNGVKCGRSVKSSRKAVEWGYTNIYWFRGGWEEWTDKSLPIAQN